MFPVTLPWEERQRASLDTIADAMCIARRPGVSERKHAMALV